MIHYHGTPTSGTRRDAAKFLRGRHAFVSFAAPNDLEIAAELCQSFAVDNGAFSAWRSGEPITNWSDYYDFLEVWHRHPAFDWAIIPDVIDGNEAANDALLEEWPSHIDGVPVWHLHESLERLSRLCRWPRVALGSSGRWAQIGTASWWERMQEAMAVICDVDGKPCTKIHGLRMLDPNVFTKFPFASADSTNAVRNANRYGGGYGGMTIIAERIEANNSAACWVAPCTELFELSGNRNE